MAGAGGAAAAGDASAHALREAAEALREADALLICTGAGMGVDSGLGTFRGRNAGVWPPLRAMGKDFSEMSSPGWFREDPRLAWAFWHFRHQAYTKGAPHAGYGLLARWGSRMRHGLFSVTSNIDGHWIRTPGVGEERTYECHGAVTHMQYVDDDGDRPWPTDDAAIERLEVPEWDLAEGDEVEARLGTGRWVPAAIAADGGLVTPSGGERLCADAVRRPNGEDLFRVREGSDLPNGPKGLLRPNVLMFGDWGVNCDRIDEQCGRFDGWIGSLPKDARLAIVEIGAGTAVRTIRSIAEGTARRFPNATFIRINLEDPSVPGGVCKNRTVSVGGLGALAALSAIDELMTTAPFPP